MSEQSDHYKAPGVLLPGLYISDCLKTLRCRAREDRGAERTKRT